MELTFIDGLRTLKLDLTLTLGIAALLLFIGYALTNYVAWMRRSALPAPVIGGLLFACAVLLCRTSGGIGIAVDSTLRAPLQIAFFTTIGFGATMTMLRAGGGRMILLLTLASFAAVVQNLVGLGIARSIGAPPALGIICGALTLTGGPATGLGFTAQFEKLGISGAASLIIASATFGILVSSLVANPIATLLIRRFHLASSATANEQAATCLSNANQNSPARIESTRVIEGSTLIIEDSNNEVTGAALLSSLLVLLVVMGAGSLIGNYLTGRDVPLPAYVGAMVVAALFRNVNDRWRFFGFNQGAMNALGTIAFALFLVLAVMDLKLWQLVGLALPAITILLVQVIVTVAYAVAVVFTLVGRDYEAAVTTSGYIGFGLGTTPNAIANMEALTREFQPAPRSFLVVPLVGAFFIDFTNILIITAFLNFTS
ncbi:MAG: hypothetical protein MSG64_04170 [Pyrinomonadaceae bacterium MAG19_C2-C3]|nr:hypothetical protein [Pyrinomonadaceae bacterium MAG19_C2-C3]